MFASVARGDQVFLDLNVPRAGVVLNVVPASVLISANALDRNLALSVRVIVWPRAMVA